MEMEHDTQLPFLGVLLIRNHDGTIGHSISIRSQKVADKKTS